MRTVESPVLPAPRVNVTYEAGLDDDGNRVEREIVRSADDGLHRGDALDAVEPDSGVNHQSALTERARRLSEPQTPSSAVRILDHDRIDAVVMRCLEPEVRAPT